MVFREALAFYACRLATGGIDLLCVFVCVDVLHWNDMPVKIAASVLVIVLNYVWSKAWVFRKGGKGDL